MSIKKMSIEHWMTPEEIARLYAAGIKDGRTPEEMAKRLAELNGCRAEEICSAVGAEASEPPSAGQDRTGQDRTGQDRTGQDRTEGGGRYGAGPFPAQFEAAS